MKLFEFIQKALSESDGYPSSIRLFSGWAIFFFVIALSFGFFYSVFKYEGLIIPFAGILSALVSGILGIKVWQKSKETTESEKPQ